MWAVVASPVACMLRHRLHDQRVVLFWRLSQEVDEINGGDGCGDVHADPEREGSEWLRLGVGMGSGAAAPNRAEGASLCRMGRAVRFAPSFFLLPAGSCMRIPCVCHVCVVGM